MCSLKVLSKFNEIFRSKMSKNGFLGLKKRFFRSIKSKNDFLVVKG